MTSNEFKNIFDAVQMDPDAKKVFLAMPREEQLLAILGMQAYQSSRLAVVEKGLISLRNDYNEGTLEARKYRVRREKREADEEGNEDHLLDTSKKIAIALSKQFNGWVWFRDRVLPSIITVITLGVLYLVFGGKLP